MFRTLSFIGLQCVAFILAFMQYVIGVRTDEAKYLLNLPYPHPPLIRTTISWTEGFAHQEFLWRIIFATLLLQATWIVWDMGRTLHKTSRMILAVSWVSASGVILYAGSLYMAPLTALQILVFLWLYDHREYCERWPGIVGILWLCTLFTAYQGILLFPVVCALILRMRFSWWERTVYFFLPVGILTLYSLTNPLAIASMMVHGSRDLSSSLFHRFLATLRIWALGGSMFTSVIGTIGLFRSRAYGAIGTFVLICAYIALSRYDYYMILFVPLAVYGLREILQHASSGALKGWIICSLFLLGGMAFIVYKQWPFSGQDPARPVMQFLSARIPPHSTVLIHGPFGHQWQYESVFPLRRYHEEFLPMAGAVICMETCPSLGREWVYDDASPWQNVLIRKKVLGNS